MILVLDASKHMGSPRAKFLNMQLVWKQLSANIAAGLNVLFLVVIIVVGLFFLGVISRHHVEVHSVDM